MLSNGANLDLCVSRYAINVHLSWLIRTVSFQVTWAGHVKTVKVLCICADHTTTSPAYWPQQPSVWFRTTSLLLQCCDLCVVVKISSVSLAVLDRVWLEPTPACLLQCCDLCVVLKISSVLVTVHVSSEWFRTTYTNLVVVVLWTLFWKYPIHRSLCPWVFRTTHTSLRYQCCVQCVVLKLSNSSVRVSVVFRMLLSQYSLH